MPNTIKKNRLSITYPDKGISLIVIPYWDFDKIETILDSVLGEKYAVL